VVWDKAASIRFKRPGRETLFAKFKLREEELVSIKSELENSPKFDRHYQVELQDKSGLIHVLVEKKIFIARKAHE